MRVGIDPSNLHEFSKDVIEYYGDGNFDVINELERVGQTLENFSENSVDPLDMGANTLDEIVLGLLIEQYTKIKVSIEQNAKQSKSKEGAK